MAIIKVNLVGIHELDLDLSGDTTATITSPGVVLVTNAAKSPTHDEPLTNGIDELVYANGDVVMILGVKNS